jgi:pullulanase/glycogen debranching enzyme
LKDLAGVLHLKKLSGAGITNVHLLPTFEFAGVDDQKENWRNVGKINNILSFEYLLHPSIMQLVIYVVLNILSELTILIDTSIPESFPPDSDQQQALITAIQNFDGYNWG